MDEPDDLIARQGTMLELDASPHDLRHHCASVLISAGRSIRAVSGFLGHKNASETLDTYSHLMPSDTHRITAAIDAGMARDVHGMCTEQVEGG